MHGKNGVGALYERRDWGNGLGRLELARPSGWGKVWLSVLSVSSCSIPNCFDTENEIGFSGPVKPNRLVGLVSFVVFTLISKGHSRLDSTFFQRSMRSITSLDAGGGAYHAIIGTLQQAGIATLITVPLGVAGAIYIVEYGRGWLANAIRFFVDVMTGIPSVVAGLFILAFWVLIVSPNLAPDGRPFYSGFAAALALSVLMLPTVTRSTEEMLRLVPTALREGARTQRGAVPSVPEADCQAVTTPHA